MTPAAWAISPRRSMTLDRPRVIAILNITPDSFSDGGFHLDPRAAVERALAAMADGADALDIGGESTRPGALPVAPDEQIRRVVPVIVGCRAQGIDAPITIDTTSAAVARAALDAGADAINDISAGRDDPAMLPLAAERACGIILMHRLRPPALDQYSTDYRTPPDYNSEGGVVSAVERFLDGRANAAQRAGIAPRSIVLDPGLGFGKSVDDNWTLTRAVHNFLALGFPLLCAASRKSFLGVPGTPSERDPAARVEASVALAVNQWLLGVRLFRAHDVRAHTNALRLAARIGPTQTGTTSVQ